VPDDITLGEVGRIAREARSEVRALVDALPEKYVLRREYETDQRNTDRRISEVAATVAKTDASVEAIEKEQAALEKERQDQASARRWQLFLQFSGPIIAAIVTILILRGEAS